MCTYNIINYNTASLALGNTNVTEQEYHQQEKDLNIACL